MKKNIFKILIVLVFVLGFNSFASASYNITLGDEWWGGGVVYFATNDANAISTELGGQNQTGKFFRPVSEVTSNGAKRFDLVTSTGGTVALNWQEFIVSNFIATPTPPVVVSTAGIFFPLDESGETTASDLTASVGNATSTTVGGLTPIVVVVMGVLLAFIAIKSVISLVYETKTSKK